MDFVPGIVQHRSIEWILQNVTSSIDGYNNCCCENMDCNHWWPCVCNANCYTMHWNRLIEDKAGDYQMSALLRSVEKRGFTSPISLFYKNGFMLGNGHHRLALAILLGADEIPTLTSKYQYYLSRSDKTYKEYDEDLINGVNNEPLGVFELISVS